LLTQLATTLALDLIIHDFVDMFVSLSIEAMGASRAVGCHERWKFPFEMGLRGHQDVIVSAAQSLRLHVQLLGSKFRSSL
jgi:hypothetical protein